MKLHDGIEYRRVQLPDLHFSSHLSNLPKSDMASTFTCTSLTSLLPSLQIWWLVDMIQAEVQISRLIFHPFLPSSFHILLSQIPTISVSLLSIPPHSLIQHHCLHGFTTETSTSTTRIPHSRQDSRQASKSTSTPSE